MEHTERKLVEVKDQRMREGVLEGLCVYDDGTEEWREPTSATVEIVNDRTGETVQATDVKIGGVSCG